MPTHAELDLSALEGREFTTAVSGMSHQLIYDPVEHSIWVFSNVGAGTPMPVFHGLQVSIASTTASFDGSGTADKLRQHTEYFDTLRDGFQGSRWDGNNHVGVWSPDGRDAEGYFYYLGTDDLFLVIMDRDELSEWCYYPGAEEWREDATTETGELDADRLAIAIERYLDEADIRASEAAIAKVADDLIESLTEAE